MRVLVCGGRHHVHDEEFIDQTLDRVLAQHGPFDRVMHGGARGVDQMAGTWARKHGILEWDFLPEWHHMAEEEGEKRNQYMIATGAPDLVIAFSGGRGTADMIKRAKEAGITVLDIGGSAKPAGS